MKGRLVVFLGISLSAVTALGGEDFGRLSSSDFKTREKANVDVHDQVAKNPANVRDEILKVYLATSDPELRVRLLPILERAYFPPKGYLGIIMQPVSRFQQGNGQVPRDRMGKGIQVMKVFPGTPAEESGLKVGDVIVEVNDWVVEGGADLNDLFAKRIQANPPSEVIRLEVKRGEGIVGLDLKLGILPVPSARAKVALQENVNGGPFLRQVLPLSVQAELNEFRLWLSDEIEKDTKSHR